MPQETSQASLQSGYPNQFDDVVVGSSPALLARAIHRASTGSKVAVIETDSVLGGSWQVRNPFGDNRYYDCFEHLLAGGPDTREFLKRSGIGLRERPLYYCVMELSESEKQLLREIFKIDALNDHQILEQLEGTFIYSRRVDRYTEAEIQDLKQKSESPTWLTARRRNLRNIYFATSADDILRRLVANLAKHRIAVFQNHRVDLVDTSGTAVRLQGTFGEIECQRALIGKYFSGRFVGSSGELDMPRKEHWRRTLIMRLRSSSPQFYDYVKFLGTPMFGSLQRVLAHEQDPDGLSTFCLFHPSKEVDGHDPMASARRHTPELIRLGLLNADSSIDAAAFLHLDFRSGAAPWADEIEKRSDGRVSLLTFVSLGREIRDNPEIWAAGLDPAATSADAVKIA